MNTNICIFCEKKRIEGKLHFPTLLNNALYLKYSQVDNQPIDDFLKITHKKWIIDFYEKLNHTTEEYLKKTYVTQELTQLNSDLIEYYKYRLDTPKLYMLPLGTLMEQYNRKRKDHHYKTIKTSLGLIKPTQNKIKTLPSMHVLADLIDDPSLSIISLLNKMKPNIKQVKSHTQSTPITKQATTQKLKTILQVDTPYKPKPNLKRSLNLKSISQSQKSVTQISRSPVVLALQNRMLFKMGSQPDIISGIYLTKNSYKRKTMGNTKKILTLLQK